MRGKREVLLNFTPSRQFKQRKVLLSAAQKLVHPRHLSMLSKGAWAFGSGATYQMTQQYDQITFRFERPNSLTFPQSDTKGYCSLPSHLFSTFSKQRLKDRKSRMLRKII